MRLVTTLVIGLILTGSVQAQTEGMDNRWITDDFDGESLQAAWNQVQGQWKTADGTVKAGGAEELLGMLNGTYIMNTRPYVIEVTLGGTGGGVVFNAACKNVLMNAQVIKVLDGSISMGYLDFLGNYIETRAVDFTAGGTAIPVQVFVDPAQHRYSLIVADRNLALEELRFNSGYAGLVAARSGVTFDSFRLSGKGTLDTPSYYIKSNKRQLDDLSYLAVTGESLLISNPLVGIVQKITSVGTYVNEISVSGGEMKPMGVWSDDDEMIYVVDATAKSVRVYNNTFQHKYTCAGNLEEPRAVVADESTVYVLDKNGIALFDKNGKSKGVKAAGLFKDPKGMFSSGSRLLVTDFGNSQVQVLNKADFSVVMTIKEELVRPWGVCVDTAGGDIYVADPGAAAVFHYDAAGKYVERIDPITIRGFVSPRAVVVLNDMVYVGDYDRILGFKKGVLTIRPSLRID